jgi:hypothetical protein
MVLIMPTMSLTTSRMSLIRVKVSRTLLRTGMASATKPGMATAMDLTTASMVSMLATIAAAAAVDDGGSGSGSGSRWADCRQWKSSYKKEEEKKS